MILLIRFILISLIIYLIVRSFRMFNLSRNETQQQRSGAEDNNVKGKKVSKEVGEYIDYEEVDDEK